MTNSQGIRLLSVYRVHDAVQVLYDLLSERTPEQSISHNGMPTLMEHGQFVHSHPYFAWYFVVNEPGEYVGSVYISKKREIGIFIFRRHQGKGYGEAAVREVMRKWPGRFLANINPQNTRSIALFSKLGFQHIQHTYAYDTVHRR